MRMFGNLSYAIDAFLCRHGDQISKVVCYIGALLCILFLVTSLVFGGVLIKEWVAAEEIFFRIFIGTWIIACVLIVPPIAAYMVRKCFKASKKFGWKNLPY